MSATAWSAAGWMDELRSAVEARGETLEIRPVFAWRSDAAAFEWEGKPNRSLYDAVGEEPIPASVLFPGMMPWAGGIEAWSYIEIKRETAVVTAVVTGYLSLPHSYGPEAAMRPRS